LKFTRKDILSKSHHSPSLLLIFICAIIIRLYGLDLHGLWYDEVCSVYFAQKELAGVVTSEVTHPPLFNLLLHFWGEFFGFRPFSMRLLPAIFGIISIFTFYNILSLYFEENKRTLGLALFCLSPFQLYFSQEIRHYMLFQLLSLATILIFMKILRGGKLFHWVVLTILVILNLYTFYFSAFIVASLLIYVLLFKREILRSYVLIMVISLLVYVPWILFFIKNASFGNRGYVSQFILRFFNVFLTFSLGYSGVILDYYDKLDMLGTLKQNLLLLFIGGVSFGLPCILGIKNLLRDKNRQGLLFLLLFFVPLFVLALLFPVFPYLNERYLIFAAPLFLLFVTSGIGSLKRRGVKVLFTSVIIALEVFSLGNYFFNDKFGKEEWREAARYVEDRDGRDIILFHKIGISKPFLFYYKGDATLYGIPAENIYDENKNLVDIKKIVLSNGRIFRSETKRYSLAPGFGGSYPLLWELFDSSDEIFLVLAKNWDTKFKYKELLDSGLTRCGGRVFPKMNGIHVFKYRMER